MSTELLTALRKPKERIIYNEKIGEGSYGNVWRAEWRDENGRVTVVAAKRIHKEFLKTEVIEGLRKEWKTLRELDHPNIVKIHTMKFDPPLFLMDLMHCDLMHYIKKSTSTPKVSPEKVVSIALGVAKGLKYLHELTPSVVHRDLASKNILLSKDDQPKIADLGIAKLFHSGQDDLATPRAGTPLYAAPETRMGKYGVSVDIFSFGVVLLEMSVGHEPRVSVLPAEGKFSEKKRRQKDIDEMKDDKLKNLVIKCLQDKSSSRQSASELVTILEKIKDERERQEAQQAPTFKRVHQRPAHNYHFKVLLLGNHNVGKTSLFELLRNPVFDIDTAMMKATMTVEPAVHYFEYNENVIKMEIVDTSGEERFFSVTSTYYRDVDGVFLVYDVSDQVSLRSLPFWIDRLKKYNSKDNLQMLLVGNKVDLRESETTDPDVFVPQEGAVEYASNIKSPYAETSVRDVDSVTAMYQNMVEILMSTVSPEDVNVQVTETARTTIRLPSSSSQNKSRENKCASSCRKV